MSMISKAEAVQAIAACRAGGIRTIQEIRDKLNTPGRKEETDDYTFGLICAIEAIENACADAGCFLCKHSFLGRQEGRETLKCRRLKRAVNGQWCCADFERWRMQKEQ